MATHVQRCVYMVEKATLTHLSFQEAETTEMCGAEVQQQPSSYEERNSYYSGQYKHHISPSINGFQCIYLAMP